MWINQRHTGENEGRGIVDWSGVLSRSRVPQPCPSIIP